MNLKCSPYAKPYDPVAERRAKRNSWLCAILFFLALIGACSFLTISGHGATFRIGQEEQPVNIIEVSPGVWRAMLLNATATIDASATLTVEQNDSLAAWQQTAGLFFYRNEGGAYTLLKIAEANAVTPVVSGNTIIWPALWTLPGGAADYEITVTDQRILKTVRFNGAAGAVLPSPTSAEFFPGAPESELGFAIGSDPFPGERAEGVTGEMDGVPIDLDDDQVVGVSMTMKWNGAFLHKFLPAYCEGLDGQGKQIYLGDLQMHFAAWSWAQAKAATWFDPSYTFQSSTYLSDVSVYHGSSTTNYDTENPMYVNSNATAVADRWIYLNIDMPAIAAAYGITASTSGADYLSSITLSLTSKGTTGGTPKDVNFYRATKAGLTSSLTWDTKGPTSELLWRQHVDWAAAAVMSTTDTASTALLNAARQCIAGATYLQLVLKPTSDWVDGAVYGSFYPIDETAIPANRPMITISLDTTIYMLSQIAEQINEGTAAIIAAISASGGTSDFTPIFEHIAAATAFVSTASSSLTTAITANNTAITQNNVILHEVDNRTRLIQSDTAAGGRVIPASGAVGMTFNLYMTQENAWDAQIYVQSATTAEPNLGFWITHGKTPTTSKTYKIATLGDSITYIGSYDSKVDAAAIGGASVYTHVYTAHYTPADATGVYHVAGICSDGTRAWPIGGDFVFGATPNLAITDQLTATAFDSRIDAIDTMLDNAAAGEIVAATVWRANALITRTTAAINIDDATDSVYIPLDGDYGYERTYRKTDGSLYTRRWLADHDEATTDKKTSKYREIGPDTTIQEWAAAQSHSISAPGRTTP